MSDNPYGRRKLPYPYSYLTRSFQAAPELNTGADPIPNFSTNFNFFVLVMTNEEQLEFSSALFAGSDLIYPDRMIEVMGQWLYAREHPNDFTGGGLVSICDAIADCIDNSPIVQDAIRRQLGDSGTPYSPDSPNTLIGTDSTYLSDELVNTGLKCTPDELAGECVAIVEQLNVIATDYIEKMIASSGFGEAILTTIEAIPFVGHLSSNDVGLYLDWITDEVLTQYNGAYNTTLRNEAACLLYAIVCEDCELTIDDMLQAFAGKVSVGINPSETWLNFIQNIVGLTLSNEIVYGIWTVILAVWKAGNVFLGINSTTALTYAASKSTDIAPSLIGCDPCGGDFTITFVANRGDGTNVNPQNLQYGIAYEFQAQQFPGTSQFSLSFDVDICVNIVSYTVVSGITPNAGTPRDCSGTQYPNTPNPTGLDVTTFNVGNSGGQSGDFRVSVVFGQI